MKQLLIDNIAEKLAEEEQVVEEMSLHIYVTSKNDESYVGEVVYPCDPGCPCVGLVPLPLDCDGCNSVEGREIVNGQVQ